MTIFNSGRIESHGGNSDAIEFRLIHDTHHARVFNTGEVIAYNEDSAGIFSHMGAATIINSGLIKGGLLSIQIIHDDNFFDGDYNGLASIHLLEGSVLVGDIGYEDRTSQKVEYHLTFGAGLNAIVRHEVGAGWELPHQIKGVNGAHITKDGTNYGIDLTTEQTARQAMLSSLGRSISSGVAHANCGGSGGEGAGYWTQPFGSAISSNGESGISNVLTDDMEKYDPTDTHAAFEGGQVGNLFGGCTPWGQSIYAGFSYGWAETSNGDHFDSETYGGFAGLRGEYDAISYGFTAGYLHHETDHQIADNRPGITKTGLKDQSDDYGTWFVMPALSYAYELDMIEELSQVVFGARYLGTLQGERTIQLDDEVAAVVEQTFAHEVSARAELHAPLATETGRLRIGAEVLWSQGEYGLEIGGQSVPDISSAFDEFTYRGIIGADIGPVSFEVSYDNNETFDVTASLRFPL